MRNSFSLYRQPIVKKLNLTLILLILLGSIGRAQPQTYNFDGIGLDGDSVTDFEIGGVAVSIQTANGPSLIAGTYGQPNPFVFGGIDINTPANPDNLDGDRFIG
ncbi:MAG: hypothetical protein AAGA30_16605, partial [Planctomycetota bacterium]